MYRMSPMIIDAFAAIVDVSALWPLQLSRIELGSQARGIFIS